MDDANCNAQEGSRCTTPIKTREIQGSIPGMLNAIQVGNDKEQCITNNISAALAADGATFFNSSPFKVLSPQPAKFLKSLLPVKEESKARKALEARPLLGQEVGRVDVSVGHRSLFIRTALIKVNSSPDIMASRKGKTKTHKSMISDLNNHNTQLEKAAFKS